MLGLLLSFLECIHEVFDLILSPLNGCCTQLIALDRFACLGVTILSAGLHM